VNLAAALAAADAIGLDPGELTRDGVEVAISRWRGEHIPLEDGGLLIADCYNANPASMAAALRHLVSAADGRRAVAVLGDMAELGPAAPGYHDGVGALAAELGVDVVAIGPLARGYRGRWFPDRDAALAALPGLLAPGDAVLVKGSRAMGLEAVVEALVP
jgi:UDP-N-acetylmuramoyl-tripeptide--D-alanyl-D-alanine ligase